MEKSDLPVNTFLTLIVKLLAQRLPTLSPAIVNFTSGKTDKLKEVMLPSTTHSRVFIFTLERQIKKNPCINYCIF